MIYILIILFCVLISVSFYTLFERKILRLRHIRLGPVVVRSFGLLQPFSDAVKLFIKAIISPRKCNFYVYLFTPVIACFSSLSCWLIRRLAETNRAPFDFAEGESELVSGFNVEYGGTGFALLFIGEYARIIFMSCLFSCLFIGGAVIEKVGLIGALIIIYFFVWVRVALPRSRYDKLISLFWFYMLPFTLILILIIIVLY